MAADCHRYGAWLVMDNTYEHFSYEGCAPHTCVEGDHVVNVFSFSKAFGMMRVSWNQTRGGASAGVEL